MHIVKILLVWFKYSQIQNNTYYTQTYLRVTQGQGQVRVAQYYTLGQDQVSQILGLGYYCRLGYYCTIGMIRLGQVRFRVVLYHWYDWVRVGLGQYCTIGMTGLRQVRFRVVLYHWYDWVRIVLYLWYDWCELGQGQGVLYHWYDWVRLGLGQYCTIGMIGLGLGQVQGSIMPLV